MPDKNGYVYLIKSGDFYKIGCTINIKRRMSEFSPVLLPFPLVLIHSIKCSDRFYAEKYLHKQYAHCRMNGEWFCLRQNEVDAIRTIQTLEIQGIYRTQEFDVEDIPFQADNADFIDHLDAQGLGGML